MNYLCKIRPTFILTGGGCDCRIAPLVKILMFFDIIRKGLEIFLRCQRKVKELMQNILLKHSVLVTSTLPLFFNKNTTTSFYQDFAKF